jgi:subfamily B ATP-binding cassette protein MsbA
VSDDERIPLRRQVAALWAVARYRPLSTVGIIGLSTFAALLEGVGLSFLVPVIEITQGNTEPGEMSGVGAAFFEAYEFVGLAFTLESVMLGVGLVMTARYTSTFLARWLTAALQNDYVRHLQTTSFERALDARVAYYDEKGSDEVLNAIVTQAAKAGGLISSVVKFVQQVGLSLVYLGVALFIAPVMTVLTVALLGALVLGMRYVAESGYAVGDRVATANERIQESAQAGTQGIRDVKLFGLAGELFGEFTDAIDTYYRANVTLARNKAAMDSLYQLLTALVVFGLIYVALAVLSLSVAALGVFLFAIFRFAPRMSTLNNLTYKIAGKLPHLVRTQEFVEGLETMREPDSGEGSPSQVREIAFEDVTFAYNETPVVRELSFSAERGEFVAFAGPSGAGKSTVVSLLTRLYDPDEGTVTANGTPIERYDLRAWRERVSMVRQHPFIFNDTLWHNLTLSNRDATEREVREACRVAQVTEFLDDLPDGLETTLGDDGVRLSGGQRQRVALARALLKDADVLVLDEATSDLDTALEAEIQRRLEATEDDRVLVVIAHRLSTVRNADRIYAMEDGQLTEAGPHDSLIEDNGTYATLYAAQRGG